MNTSGLILDIDDDNGELLKVAYPQAADLEALPENIKVATVLSARDRESLPDDVFALVLREGTSTLRKYACVDAGNTELAMGYFIEHGHKLDKEAQQQTAENFKVACSWYDLPVPEAIEKTALLGAIGKGALNYAAKNPLSTAMKGMQLQSTVSGVKQKAQQNLAAIRAGEQHMGGTAGGLHAMAVQKFAEATGTSDMPTSGPNVGKLPEPKKKMASIIRDTQKVEYVSSTKVAQQCALPSQQKYPLDSYVHVKQASEYFDKHSAAFAPEERREYCVNLVKRASELGIPVSSTIVQYGSDERAGIEAWEQAKTARARMLHPEDQADCLRLLDKVAEQRELVSPDQFAGLLGEFDKVAGLTVHYDREVPDPYLSSFEKVAEDSPEEIALFKEMIDNTYITGPMLKEFSMASLIQVRNIFGDDVAKEFRKSPVSTFKSLPIENRKQIAVMVNDNAPGVDWRI